MAQQTVNTTDTVEQMRGKVNANFTEVYSLGLPAYYTDTGGDDAYVITTDIAYSALTAGMAFALKPTTGNTGACTLAVDSTGAIAIKVIDASGVRDPITGEIPAGGLIWVQYNGTYWVLLNPIKRHQLSHVLFGRIVGTPVTTNSQLGLCGSTSITAYYSGITSNYVIISGMVIDSVEGVRPLEALLTNLTLSGYEQLSIEAIKSGALWYAALFADGLQVAASEGYEFLGDIEEMIATVSFY